ncbi:MAG TPA: HypC/HybG/HupF family hydrogenase formation chaperone [Polyangiaceae bacterium]
MCLSVPGRVVELRNDGELPMGKVDFGGVAREVCLAYVPDVRIGEYVLVHVGFALSKLDAGEAERLRALLEELTGADLGGEA